MIFRNMSKDERHEAAVRKLAQLDEEDKIAVDEDIDRQGNYRVTRQVEAYILLTSIWGVLPACGPLLQLATAQASQGNSPN